jgi:hypothetical protein
VAEGENAIAEIAKLTPLVLELLEALERVREPLAKALVAPVDVSLSTADDRRVKLDLRVTRSV